MYDYLQNFNLEKMKEDLRHLKWTLINKNGCSKAEAEARIKELREVMKEGSKKKEKDAGKNT